MSFKDSDSESDIEIERSIIKTIQIIEEENQSCQESAHNTSDVPHSCVRRLFRHLKRKDEENVMNSLKSKITELNKTVVLQEREIKKLKQQYLMEEKNHKQLLQKNQELKQAKNKLSYEFQELTEETHYLQTECDFLQVQYRELSSDYQTKYTEENAYLSEIYSNVWERTLDHCRKKLKNQARNNKVILDHVCRVDLRQMKIQKQLEETEKKQKYLIDHLSMIRPTYDVIIKELQESMQNLCIEEMERHKKNWEKEFDTLLNQNKLLETRLRQLHLEQLRSNEECTNYNQEIKNLNEKLDEISSLTISQH